MFAFILGDLGITLAPGVAIDVTGVDPSFRFDTSIRDGAFTFIALTDAHGGPPTVPEPATLLLVAAAFPVLALLARRRNPKRWARG